MGHRLHVAKKYEIEYSSIESFNHEVEEFHNLLSVLGISYTGDSCDDDFEVYKDEWSKGIEKLKNLSEQIDEYQISKALDKLNEGADDIIDFMEQCLVESDKSSDYMFLSFY